jgi:hypothetical protein
MLFEQKRGQTNVTSLVERVSRFTVILKNSNKRTKPVMGKIMKAIKDLPHQARRSITFDRSSRDLAVQDPDGTRVASSSAGPNYRLRLAHKPGSVTLHHRGKRERWRTQIAGHEDGCRVR